jgi:hypothetical protein
MKNTLPEPEDPAAFVFIHIVPNDPRGGRATKAPVTEIPEGTVLSLTSSRPKPEVEVLPMTQEISELRALVVFPGVQTVTLETRTEVAQQAAVLLLMVPIVPHAPSRLSTVTG